MYVVKGIEAQWLQHKANQVNKKFDKLHNLTQSLSSASVQLNYIEYVAHPLELNAMTEQVHAIQTQPRQWFNNYNMIILGNLTLISLGSNHKNNKTNNNIINLHRQVWCNNINIMLDYNKLHLYLSMHLYKTKM